jgi:hypothetical protein
MTRRIRSRRSRIDKGSCIRIPDEGRARRTVYMPISLSHTASTGASLSDTPCLSGGLGGSGWLSESGSGQVTR